MADHANKRDGDRLYSLRKTEVEIKGAVYRVFDIGAEGIGVMIEDRTAGFFIGQRIESIPIALESGTKYLNGIVAHISRNRDGQICGIHFQFSDKGEYDWLAAYKQERSIIES